MVDISINFDLFNNYYYFYERLIVLFVSLVPTLLLIWFVLYTDKKSKEPAKNTILCVLSGILTVALAGYVENLVMPFFSNNVILTYVWAFIEELSKIAIFFLFIFDNKYYDDIYDGIVYMALIALSFAGLENVMYAFSENTISESISLSLMRDFTTIPLHVICGIIIGYFVSIGNFSKDKRKRKINFLLAILIPSLVHGTFNVLMSSLGSIKVDYNSSIQLFIFQFLPIIIIMGCLFYMAYKFSSKTIKLNKVYVDNGKYDKKYNYLMTYDEYMESYYMKKRSLMYDKTKLFNKKGDN